MRAMCRPQSGSFAFPPTGSSTVFVNDRVSYRTEGTTRVISVHGVVFGHYDTGDHAAEMYAMVTLVDAGYADQNDVARAFGCSTRTLRRYEAHYETGGVAALVRGPGRPASSMRGASPTRRRDKTILALKTRGASNRSIGGKLGVDERVVRRTLQRLGWQQTPDAQLPLDSETRPIPTPPPDSAVRPPDAPATCDGPAAGEAAEDGARSLDVDPLNRSVDRLLAAMGLLDDAAPLFAPADSLRGAGVLLAVPPLVASGLLTVARTVYGSIGPAFYGLRTTLVAYVLLVLLRIPRPEMLKEYSPPDLGRVIGLDRMPEVKTLRRKLARLAAMGRAQDFGRRLAERRIAARGRLLGFLYVDGHVRAYHGKRPIAKTYMTRARTAGPATTDYWVNDQKGDPLFVVTAEANATMTRMLVPILEALGPLFGARRRLTVVFDRAGWSPKLFRQILRLGFDMLTYRKGHARRIAEKRFLRCATRIDGRRVEYWLHDQPVRFLNGTFRLRQVTRLTPGTGHQTPILTSRWDLRAVMVAYRMFERWRQENFFKYMREEFLIDTLTDYATEADNPDRLVPNPARKRADQQVRQARLEISRLREAYGATAVDYLNGRPTTMRAFTKEERRIHRELEDATGRLATLVAQRKSVPTRIPLSQAPGAAEAVKLSTERKHLTNVLKMVAFQTEGALVQLLEPYYARHDDEGRTLIQTALRGAAAIAPADDELRVTLSPLSSPHRSEAVRALCADLNSTKTVFPGTTQRLTFAVAEPPAR
jgi:hypothetical protein